MITFKLMILWLGMGIASAQSIGSECQINEYFYVNTQIKKNLTTEKHCYFLLFEVKP